MSGTCMIDLALLPARSLADLRALWSTHMGRAAPPVQKRLLIRELAWRIQAKAHGGLDAQTSRLLKAAMRVAGRQQGDQQVGSRRRRHDGAASGPTGQAAPRAPAAPALVPGTRLVRTWHGRSQEVTVLDGGRAFRYRDQTYTSLSEIARLITGTRWSGPRFFGVVSRRKQRVGLSDGDRP